MKSNEQRVIEKIRLLFFIVNELICAIIKQINKSVIWAAVSNGVYLEKNYSSMCRKNQYKEEFWTLLPAKAMVLNGLDAHSINEMKKGYNGVVVE